MVKKAIIISIAHSYYLSHLFENDRHFSYLADFEREMSYRTEMGLYYSYYKTIINADTFTNGLSEIIHDEVTEYGHQINTLNRFNLYPEVIIAYCYRIFRQLNHKFQFSKEVCWSTNRGNGLDPIVSCEGLINQHYFYINSVFMVAGTVAGSIFVLGALVSDSFMGGFLALAGFVFNHGECTRVQWTPPLRESFGYPLILIQITSLTLILKLNPTNIKLYTLFTITTILSCLYWQFSQFIFFTQIFALFLMYITGYLQEQMLTKILASHAIAFTMSFVLLFANEMMLASLYVTSLLAAFIVKIMFKYFERNGAKVLTIPLRLVAFVVIMVTCKHYIAQIFDIHDDAHIFEIMKSKFSDFENFHTRLYTCAPEFDFITSEPFIKITKTLVLPLSIVGILTTLKVVLSNELTTLTKPSNTPQTKANTEQIYNVLQAIAFTMLATLIMRLKLFMTPHLAVTSTIGLCFIKSIPLPRYFPNQMITVALISMMAISGLSNVKEQLGKSGEYSNPDQEFLFKWINESTLVTDVFAGPMPIMANVKLSTLRPILNHPHYENVEIRERTLKVYSIFSKKPVKDVHGVLKEMGVKFVILQPHNCQGHPPLKPHCSYRSMWDLQDPTNQENVSMCDLIQQTIQTKDQSFISPFYIIYNQRNYIVLQV
uniref:C-mannosyltransferase dpy-19 n=1 Tax=Rhabditophanes sp. KR3021 TaxID=114890 RepID=A0AC35UB26_9BILA